MTLFFAGETLSPEDIKQSKQMKLDMKVGEIIVSSMELFDGYCYKECD